MASKQFIREQLKEATEVVEENVNTENALISSEIVEETVNTEDATQEMIMNSVANVITGVKNLFKK